MVLVEPRQFNSTIMCHALIWQERRASRDAEIVKDQENNMLPLFKKRIAAHDLANIFIERIQRDARDGQSCKPFLDKVKSENIENVRQEWLYFDVFNIEYFAFLALGQSNEKQAILNPFWSEMKRWLTTAQVSPVSERSGLFDGDIKTVPAESKETAYDRLKRRCDMYGAAITKPHRQGENYSVGLTFAILCNELDLAFVVGVSTFFHTRKMEWVNILRSYRITMP